MLHWSDIRGQQRPLDILQTALDTGRVHHAYLFTGLQGVGKFLTAQTFAAVVNCEARPEGEFREACGQCSSCRKIAQKQHPDILFVEPERDRIKIAQIREVQQASSRAPYEARFRFVLIDEAHTMTDEAANALLKTLEEPSARMRLILVTDQPHGLLDTIISRCQVLRFGSLDQEQVVELLTAELSDPDDPDALPDPDTLRVAAGYGEGSVGRSLAVIESEMLDERRSFIERVTSLPPGEAVPLLELAEELSSDRRELHTRLDVLKLFFRDVMLYQAAGRADRLVNADMLDLVEAFSQRVATDDLLELIDQVRRAQQLLMRNVHAQLIAEDLLGDFRRRSQRV